MQACRLEGNHHRNPGRKGVPGRGNSEGRGPEAGRVLAHSRGSTETLEQGAWEAWKSEWMAGT